MIPKTTVESLVGLGRFFENWAGALSGSVNVEPTPLVQKALLATSRAGSANGWFTKENIILALNSWAAELNRENLENWLKPYVISNPSSPKKIGLILAGNIPLVGLHDIICVLVAGHIAYVKPSSDDAILLPVVLDFLLEQNPNWKDSLVFSPGIIKDADAFIATGSNNSARYFDYYFGKKPSIIRKNRSSVAVLTGNESKEDLMALGSDIFSYYGLGCRNVSKLLVPEGYRFDTFFESIVQFGEVINNKKYGNNYDYHRAVYLLDSVPMLDNNFLLLKPDTAWSSPIGVMIWDSYSDENDLRAKLSSAQNQLQCIVAHNLSGVPTVDFGKTQFPRINDYADGIDTLKFLTAL